MDPHLHFGRDAGGAACVSGAWSNCAVRGRRTQISTKYPVRGTILPEFLERRACGSVAEERAAEELLVEQPATGGGKVVFWICSTKVRGLFCPYTGYSFIP